MCVSIGSFGDVRYFLWRASKPPFCRPDGRPGMAGLFCNGTFGPWPCVRLSLTPGFIKQRHYPQLQNLRVPPKVFHTHQSLIVRYIKCWRDTLFHRRSSRSSCETAKVFHKHQSLIVRYIKCWRDTLFDRRSWRYFCETSDVFYEHHLAWPPINSHHITLSCPSDSTNHPACLIDRPLTTQTRSWRDTLFHRRSWRSFCETSEVFHKHQRV